MADLIGIAARYFTVKAKYGILLLLLKLLVTQFFTARFAFFEKESTGLLLNSLQREIETVGDSFGTLITFIIVLIQVSIFSSPACSRLATNSLVSSTSLHDYSAALARDLALIETTGVRAHISQVSCARSVEKIREAKARGLRVTAAVSAHHLHLSEQDIGEFDTRYHVMPPLRSLADRDALRQGVISGVIDAVCSDHQPHGIDAKLAPFSESAAGISGLETLLSLVLKLVDETALSLPDAIARVTINPAKILGIEVGRLLPGSQADICIFDPTKYSRATPDSSKSRGLNNVFLDQLLPGTIKAVLVAGRTIA